MFCFFCRVGVGGGGGGGSKFVLYPVVFFFFFLSVFKFIFVLRVCLSKYLRISHLSCRWVGGIVDDPAYFVIFHTFLKCVNYPNIINYTCSELVAKLSTQFTLYKPYTFFTFLYFFILAFLLESINTFFII